MKASEVIKKMQDIVDREGDIDVLINVDCEGLCSVDVILLIDRGGEKEIQIDIW